MFNLATALKIGQLYLKTVDRSKVTPEGVAELAHLLDRQISDEDAATVANAIRTRGRPDASSLAILAKVMGQHQKPLMKSITVACPKCGWLKTVNFAPDDLPDFDPNPPPFTVATQGV